MINPDIVMKEVTLDSVKDEIKSWYDEKKYHYITVNAIDNGDSLTIDWVFSEYDVKNKIYVFRVVGIAYDSVVPSMVDVIPSAWLSEWDLADMFDLNIENAVRGMFLQPEAPKAPLRKETYNGK
jgi:Ni,Fe-hydrogenase III component G